MEDVRCERGNFCLIGANAHVIKSGAHVISFIAHVISFDEVAVSLNRNFPTSIRIDYLTFFNIGIPLTTEAISFQ